MAKTKSLHELKQATSKKKNNTLTDSDYFLRDKEAEALAGYPNTIDITPIADYPKVEAPAKAVAKPKGE